VAEHHAGSRREAHAAPGRLEQRVPELALERRQLLGHRRGREVQGVSRGRERAVIGDGAQRSQAAEIDHEADLTGHVHKVQSLLLVVPGILDACPAATSSSPPPSP
jgi:hypothetical protein